MSTQMKDIKTRIKADTSWLTMKHTEYTQSLETLKLRQMLGRFVEVRRQSRETSVFSVDTSRSLTPNRKEVRRQIRKDLQSAGLTPEIFYRNKSQIVTLLRGNLPEHELEDIQTEDMDLEDDTAMTGGIEHNVPILDLTEEPSQGFSVPRTNGLPTADRNLTQNEPGSNLATVSFSTAEMCMDVSVSRGSISHFGHWHDAENSLGPKPGRWYPPYKTSSIQEAVRRVELEVQHTWSKSRLRTMLQGIISGTWLVDDDALDSILTIANKAFFHEALSGRVGWHWSQEYPYSDACISSTGVRSSANGGYETSIMLSASLRAFEQESEERAILIRVFLHELIQCYLFISCGIRDGRWNERADAIRNIAEAMDRWTENIGFNLSGTRMIVNGGLNLSGIRMTRNYIHGEWALEQLGTRIQNPEHRAYTQIVICVNRLEHENRIFTHHSNQQSACNHHSKAESMIGMTLSGSLHILDVVNTMSHQVLAEDERVVYKAFDSRTQLWYAVKAFNKTSPDLRQYE
ncbi:hypothetical protein BGZ57DRAFT_966754 [Hyaloscypha finlandica]|nr:hypothetical protein BGZ57DRAFT_966754 [Hyaloscypha finlandica]